MQIRKKKQLRGMQDTEVRKDLNANTDRKNTTSRRRGPKTRTTYMYKHNILQSHISNWFVYYI